MAVLQALLAFLSRSIGKIFQALFGWAVVALFGVRPRSQRSLLSAAVGAAAVWPVLVLGTVFPRVATTALTLVPVPRFVPAFALRIVWVVASLAVPFALGALLPRYASWGGPSPSPLTRMTRGFSATAGIALAFLVVVITVPVRKVASLVRRRKDEHLPLVVSREAYEDVSARIDTALRDAGTPLSRRAPPGLLTAPSAVLRAVGGEVFRREVPERPAYFEGPALSALVSPNGVTLQGIGTAAARAHGLLAEALTWSEALQTFDPEAQKLERRLKELRPGRPALRAPTQEQLPSARLAALGGELLRLEAPYDDWQVLYRQALQVSRRLNGEGSFLKASGLEAGPEHLIDPSPPEREIEPLAETGLDGSERDRRRAGPLRAAFVATHTVKLLLAFGVGFVVGRRASAVREERPEARSRTARRVAA